MTKLISKLPFELRRHWVKESVTIESRNNGRVGQFNDFVNFFVRESEGMNSVYGGRVFGSPFKSKSSHKKATKSTSNFVVSNVHINDNALPSTYCFNGGDIAPQNAISAFRRAIVTIVEIGGRFQNC